MPKTKKTKKPKTPKNGYIRVYDLHGKADDVDAFDDEQIYEVQVLRKLKRVMTVEEVK